MYKYYGIAGYFLKPFNMFELSKIMDKLENKKPTVVEENSHKIKKLTSGFS
jgi:YesN/AraC family two-component response regulator